MYQNNIYLKPNINQRGKFKTNKVLNQKISINKNIKRKPSWIKLKTPINNRIIKLNEIKISGNIKLMFVILFVYRYF